MKLVRLVWHEFVGLFVDDEFLAIAILAVIAVSAATAWGDLPSLVVGSLLLAGCVGVLLASVVRGASRSRRK